MRDSGWQQELFGRAGSHSGICPGSRHSNCQLCGLGKVWCPYEPWVSQDNQRVLGVWGTGGVGWHSLQLRGLWAGNRCWQCHLWGKGASMAASVFKGPSGFLLCVTSSTLCAGFQGGFGMKSIVPTSHFGSAEEPKTCEQLSAASWETSPQVAWQRQCHAT